MNSVLHHNGNLSYLSLTAKPNLGDFAHYCNIRYPRDNFVLYERHNYNVLN